MGGLQNKQHGHSRPLIFVFLNVGGKEFMSTSKNLEKSKYLKDLIKSNSESLEGKIALSINRDSNLFRQVLFYLRTGLIIPNDEEGVKQLLSEAKFYQCQEMVNALQIQLDKIRLSQQASTKMGLEFIDLKKMFDQDKSTYTLIKKTGDAVEAYSVVDYINVFSRDEYKDKRCEHRKNDCRCYYYPKLVLVPQQKHS
ncbi:uncharacterized protein ATC70_006119 [Mucor velutinosus]|uniref:BTB domain-containing protein n=1 Tax=Mucor velutinosus TaxID=708070 RepID=A0AAN7DAW6_9FUNG|nr:hypothetical protein ATC70_006119 [Mucor velutinosus]